MEQLRKSYGQVASQLFEGEDFLNRDLESSRAVFDPKSLVKGLPRPAKLNVVALVGGLPFDDKLVEALCLVQKDIAQFTDGALAYWVRPTNFAVEVCVFKWPEEQLLVDRHEEICATVKKLAPGPFLLDVHGVQAHRDGAVIARGFDSEGLLRRLRSQLMEELDWMPRRQSSWAHIPLGRILEPIGAANFRRLQQASPTLWSRRIGQTQVRTLQLIFESRWYMEERTTYSTFILEGSGY